MSRRYLTLALRRALRGVLVFTIILAPMLAHGLGLRIPNQDAAAIARGNAFVATADNPSALYYNPAGITQLEGHHFQAGSLLYLGIYADFVSPAGSKTKNEHDVIAAPQLHYTFSPKDSQFSFGLGVFAPFGLGMEWPDHAPFAPYGLEGRLNYATLTPVVAWKPHQTLSLAVGPTFNYSDVKLRQSIPGVDGGEFVFRGDDNAYGFTAGVLWQPCSKVSLGASYFSATSQNYDGTASTSPSPPLPSSAGTSARFDFPQIIRGGISYRPTPKWNFEVDIDWTDWETVDNLTIKGVSAIPLNWHSSFFYEAGVTRYLKNGYYVSAGYFFSEASTSERYYTPILPDTDLHVGSVGFGHKGKSWDWALAGQIIAGPYRNVDDAVAPPVRGKYQIVAPTISFSVGYHF